MVACGTSRSSLVFARRTARIHAVRRLSHGGPTALRRNTDRLRGLSLAGVRGDDESAPRRALAANVRRLSFEEGLDPRDRYRAPGVPARREGSLYALRGLPYGQSETIRGYAHRLRRVSPRGLSAQPLPRSFSVPRDVSRLPQHGRLVSVGRRGCSLRSRVSRARRAAVRLRRVW